MGVTGGGADRALRMTVYVVCATWRHAMRHTAPTGRQRRARQTRDSESRDARNEPRLFLFRSRGLRSCLCDHATALAIVHIPNKDSSAASA